MLDLELIEHHLTLLPPAPWSVLDKHLVVDLYQYPVVAVADRHEYAQQWLVDTRNQVIPGLVAEVRESRAAIKEHLDTIDEMRAQIAALKRGSSVAPSFTGKDRPYV